MLRVSLRGLATRRLRSALTALAIVLGVALVAGTFVLTDSITGAFNTIFQTIYSNTDATVTGRNAIDSSATGGAAAATATRVPPFSQSLLTRVERAPGRQVGGRRRVGQPAAGPEREGDPVWRRPEPRLQRRSGKAPVQLAQARQRQLAGADRSRDRHQHGVQEKAPHGPGDRGSGRRSSRAAADLGPGQVRLGFIAGRRDARGPPAADRTAAAGPRRQARRDPREREVRHDPEAAGRADTQDPAAPHAGANRRPTGTAGLIVDQQLPVVLEDVPARVRGRGTVRRQLRDRQLALDHDRAANARVRDAADARRLADARCGDRSWSSRS